MLFRSRRASLVRLGAIGNAASLTNLGKGKRRAKRVYLLLETPEFASALRCTSEDEEARAFADLVNIAALNAADFARTRSEAITQAEANLARLRAKRSAAIERAAQHHAEVEADQSAIEDARRALLETEKDIVDLEECRARLAALEPGAKAARPEHPSSPPS